MALERKIAFDVVNQYPFVAGKVVFIDNAKNVLLDNHLLSIANFYGYNWKTFPAFNITGCACAGYKSNFLLRIAYYLFALIYCILYVFFIIYLLKLFQKKQWWILTFLIVFVAMFLIPTFIGGSGGARFRIDVEWLIIFFSFYQISLFFKARGKGTTTRV
jgi:hypothetical protein